MSQQAMVRGQPSRFMGLETRVGWLIASNTPRYFCHAKQIYTSWLYTFSDYVAFFKSFHTFSQHNKIIFAATGEYFK